MERLLSKQIFNRLANSCLVLVWSISSFSQQVCPIIPTPSVYQPMNGVLEVQGRISINEKGIPEPIREYLIKKCTQELGLLVVFTPVSEQLDFKKLINVPKNYYSLRIDRGITIQYSSEESCFYALTSLFQLMEESEGKFHFQKCFISDAPKYGWRGMHLDVSRHFFSVQEVKRFIDIMSLYKFNTFHWHLTDDQGWRIEIKKYPKLTEVGAWRDSTVIGHYSVTPRSYDKSRYGGFYTQEDIREIVAYAAERYITVVPEIEMPGHARAAIAAYPSLSCSGESLPVPGLWGVFDDIFCMHESTLDFVKNVLDEVLDLFPSTYIHIGGDEAPKVRWKKCKKCQAVIRENGLHDEEQLQGWFVAKVDEYLTSKGRKLIGWDEILEGGLSENATVMSWRGAEGGIAAARQKHYAVMSPGGYCYFDHYQSKDRNEPLAIGGYTPLEKVYAFQPVPEELTPDEAAYILGAQANLWTEYIPDMRQLEYMAFPRALALAQVLWCQNKPDFEYFEKVLFQHQFPKLQDLKVNYSKAIFYPEMRLHPKKDKVGITFSTSLTNGKLKVSILDQLGVLKEEKEVGSSDTLFVERSVGFHTYSYVLNPSNTDKIFTYSLMSHPSLALPIEIDPLPDERYSGNGWFTLTDGLIGAMPWKGNDWLGFDEKKIEINIDLQRNSTVKGIKLGFLQDQGSWIYYPDKMSLSLSKNGRKWKTIEIKQIGRQSAEVFDVKARYVKVVIETDEITEGNPGAGHVPWTFMDELILNFEP
ncbi:MAG: beta-N-acetylhexosaminidase [Cryomorphaceae bacterium]|jgi:hexosaminidase|nr:beta-N-acetylhexosaminidase [Cryomorphaceae bacterium]